MEKDKINKKMSLIAINSQKYMQYNVNQNKVHNRNIIGLRFLIIHIGGKAFKSLTLIISL